MNFIAKKIFKGLPKLVLISLGVALATASQAQLLNLPDSTAVSDQVKQRITLGMSKAIPDFEIQAISKTPAAGLYSVQVLGGPKVFINGQGNFVLNEQGQAITIVAGSFAAWKDPVELLKDQEIKRIANTTLNKIPSEEMIIYPAKGEKKAHIFVFTDVDCGYCKKLHLEVPGMTEKGIEVRYLAFPRSGPIGASADKLARAFCAEDRGAALTELKSGGGLDLEVCADTPIQEQYKLVRVLGLRGTPGIFLEDGTLISGYRTAEEIAEILDI